MLSLYVSLEQGMVEEAAAPSTKARTYIVRTHLAKSSGRGATSRALLGKVEAHLLRSVVCSRLTAVLAAIALKRGGAFSISVGPAWGAILTARHPLSVSRCVQASLIRGGRGSLARRGPPPTGVSSLAVPAASRGHGQGRGLIKCQGEAHTANR